MGRPRGFAEWRPQKNTLVNTAVQGVLDQYGDYLPLTIRQIFYRLVGTDVIGKSEREYGNLCEMLNRATRARMIPMDAIRDDGFIGGFHTRIGYTGPQEFQQDVQTMAEQYVGDRQRGQDRRLVMWCEAGGMVPQLERVADPYGITLKSSAGFDSRTVKHEIGKLWDETTILHIGDYDPSGECMYDPLAEDVDAFGLHYGHGIEFTRLAVTPAQIAEHGLPTAPPKASSHQVKKRLAFTVQAEALNPAILAEIARQGIESRVDMAVYLQAVEREQADRAAILDWWVKKVGLDS